MPTSLRARIVAVVSGERQAGDDLASLPLQVERSREAIKRHGWDEVAEPVCIAQSRDFYRLQDLRADSPDFDELCHQVERGEVDILIGRDHSRVLGRTESLQVEFRTFLQLRRVQWYFYTSPTVPMSPDQLGRRGRGQIGTRYLDAVSAVRDEEEVARIMQRFYDGMNAHAKAGRWKHPSIAYGYVRREIGRGGIDQARRFLGPPEAVPEEAAIVQRAFEAYRDGADFEQVGASLSEWTRQTWSYTTARQMLLNPFYVGVMVWGRKRADVVPEGEKVKKVARRLVGHARAADLASAFLRGEDARTAREQASDVIVAAGQWEPIITPELWLAVQHERTRRATERNVAATTTKRAHYPLSGLLRCGYCGSRMIVGNQIYYYADNRVGPDGTRPGRKVAAGYVKKVGGYTCSRHHHNTAECQSNGIIAPRVLSLVLDELRRLAEDEQGMFDLVAQEEPNRGAIARQVAAAEGKIKAAEQAVINLIAAVAAGGLSPTELAKARESHDTAKRQAEAELARLRAYVPTNPAEQVARLRALVARLDELAAANGGRLKAALRQLVESISVESGEITEIRFRG